MTGVVTDLRGVRIDVAAGIQRMTTRQFIGFGGVRLTAELYGNPDDPGVLFLPGGGQTRLASGTIGKSPLAAVASLIS